jgi:hypothetical protein
MFYTFGSLIEIRVVLHSSKYSYANVSEMDRKYLVTSVLHFQSSQPASSPLN